MGADGAGGGSNESRLSEHSRKKGPLKVVFELHIFFVLKRINQRGLGGHGLARKLEQVTTQLLDPSKRLQHRTGLVERCPSGWSALPRTAASFSALSDITILRRLQKLVKLP